MATIDSYDFKGKRAIVRVDFNVPLDENGKITDDTRRCRRGPNTRISGSPATGNG